VIIFLLRSQPYELEPLISLPWMHRQILAHPCLMHGNPEGHARIIIPTNTVGTMNIKPKPEYPHTVGEEWDRTLYSTVSYLSAGLK